MSSAKYMHWTGSFAESDAETVYRTHRLETDRKLIHVVCGIVVLAVCGYLLNDLRDPRPHEFDWQVLIGARVAIVLVAAVYSIALGRIRDVRVMDAFSLLMMIAVVFSSLWANAYRPKDFYTHVGADVVILIGIYLVIPIAQSLRLGGAAAYSCGLAYLYFVYKTPPDAMTETSAAVSLVIANLMGFLICFRHAYVQRSQFTAYKNERAARQALEEARSEIRSLSGLIPICANCKSVRNDEGFWEQVESYVRDRSEAEFSHSLCPKCAELYEPPR